MELRTIIDTDHFRGLLADFSGRMKDLEPAMKLVGQFVCESIDDTFAAEGRPDAWKALSDATTARKPAGLRILEGESKRLREGIHVEDTGRNYVDVAPDDLPSPGTFLRGGKAIRGI